MRSHFFLDIPVNNDAFSMQSPVDPNQLFIVVLIKMDDTIKLFLYTSVNYRALIEAEGFLVIIQEPDNAAAVFFKGLFIIPGGYEGCNID